MTEKPTICIDFNGVLDDYKGWRGENYQYPMKDGADAFLAACNELFNIVILTAINSDTVWKQLVNWKVDKYVIEVTNVKVPAIAYIDDRAIQFNGDFVEVFQQLLLFKPYWLKD